MPGLRILAGCSPLLFLLCFFPAAKAQGTFGDFVPPGKSWVGFCDTLLYNDSIHYRQFGYEGPAPLFVQVWHPLKKQPKRLPLTYGQFRKDRKVPGGLKPVYDRLNAQTDTVFVESALRENLLTGDPLVFPKHSLAQIADSIQALPSLSYPAPVPAKGKRPVIVYHHGTRGISDENAVMAEYFASRGYVFVSSNFHLPYETEPFGLHEGVRGDRTSVKTLLRYARALANGGPVYYVGHSWGAQVGWFTLYEKGLADAFVSMETTIEFKKDSAEIKDKWPFVYDALALRREQFSLPVLLLANTRKNEPFRFFTAHCTGTALCASAKEDFVHESYTSVFLSRYFLRSRFPQADDAVMKGQLELYAAHLRLLDAFFQSVRSGKAPDRQPFRDRFFLD